MKYISSKRPTTRKFQGTIKNPANIGSRGTNIKNLPKEWWDGARWLAYPDCWPKQKKYQNKGTWETSQDNKRSHMYIGTEKSEEIYQLIKNFQFWKVIRIASWIYRFLENWKRKEKLSDPLKRNENKKQKYSE